MRTIITLIISLMTSVTLASTQLYTLSVRDAQWGDFATYEIRNELEGSQARLNRTPRTDAWIEIETRNFKVLRQLEFKGDLKGTIYLLQEDSFGDARPQSLLYKNEDNTLHLTTRGNSSREFIMRGTLDEKEVRVTFEKFAGRSTQFDDSQYNAFGDQTFLRSYVSGTDWSYRVKVWGKITADENKQTDQLASALGFLMLHIQNPTSR